MWLKSDVSIPAWLFVLLLAGTLLNILNFVIEKADDEPKIHIHYYDERK